MPIKPKKRHKFNMQGVPPRMAVALKLVYEGALFLDAGATDKAETTFRRAVEIDPESYTAWSFLTDLLCKLKRNDEALLCLERLIATSPRTVATVYSYAEKSFFLDKFDQARKLVEEAFGLLPSHQLQIKLQLLLVRVHFKQQDYQAAILGASQILDAGKEIDATIRLAALELRQKSYSLVARVPEDVADSRLLLALQPNARTHSHLLFHLNYLSSTTPELLYQESLRFNDTYVSYLASEILPHANDPDPTRRLKIAYISPDFRNHAIIKLLPVAFEHIDQAQFEIFAYSVDTQDDSLTQYVRSWVPNFVELRASGPGEDSDASYARAIAERVRADDIDILVDLAGHTMPLGAFLALGLKPAPVQVTWMGVMATTGLSTMDYFLGNAQIPPPGTEHTFTEKIYRLPGAHACYRPTNNQAELAPSPYFSNKYITFGCFNSPKKITRETVQAWSVILHLHPGSKLLLKYKDLDREYAQRHLREWFADDGIAPDRLLFEGISLPSHYLLTWNKVDIALDPFPYNGGTTTYDALWMGVPVVTIGGRLCVSCGSRIVSDIGLPVAATLEQYVSIAGQLAKAIPTEPGIRQRVRSAMLNSHVVDEARLARDLGNAYREMWRTWCAKQIQAPQDC